ncbi:MAG: beta-propeller domain-containing protein [Deltaproteobacteria bacterium]|nr:beta-propeller domain-containing protein [Deltaproteobacteria bacterium]
MKIHSALVLLAAVGTSAFAVGCGSSEPSVGTTGTTRASLHRAKGCGDLLVDLKADASFKLNKGIDRQIEQIKKCIARNNDASCAYYGGYYGGARGSAEGDMAAPMPGSSANGSSSSGGTGASSPPPKAGSYSETNTQVKGVDEADFVKTDGSNLYVLHGKQFKIVKAWPSNDLKELANLDIEGTPTEMFVADGKAVVYSTVNGAKLYDAAGVKPKDTYNDYSYYGPGGGPMPMTDSVGGASSYPYPGGGGTAEKYIPLTKITVLALNGAAPAVTREVYFEGNYLSSRRVGSHVRTVLSGQAHGPKLKYSISELYPQPSSPATTPGGGAPTKDTTDYTTPSQNPYPKTGTEMIAALEQLRTANANIIAASTLEDWIPYTFTRNGPAVQAQTVACQDFYVPSTGSTASGLTEVATIDLANPTALPRETAILGNVDTVYGSADTLYLAAHAYVEPPFAWADDSAVSSGGVAEAVPAPPPSSAGGVGATSVRPATTLGTPVNVVAYAMNATHVHKFEFASDPTFPNYIASGTVPGSVKNQFSLDDKDGHLRIATTEQRMYVDGTGKYVQPTWPGSPGPLDRPQTVNHVYVLGVNGPWLDTKGKVENLAANERIYSVRFVDNRGYVVTFRQVDPLFVFDLTNPSAPQKLSELKIPGFSEYMHPLDANHILTIGRDASDQGRVQGLQLQIFDVTDGHNPILNHKFTYTGSEYGQSEAEGNHKAFTYFADKKLLAFPYYAYDGGSGMRSSLELFAVDVGTGFAKRGSIDHTALVSKNPTGYCGGYYGPQVRRGVFLENFVYSISYGGVIVKDANNLGAVGSTLGLNAPTPDTGYGPSCGY